MANVLIIDDDIYLTEDLKFFIEEEGHNCVVYNQADDVMDNFDSLTQFNWIILDLMMLKGGKIKNKNTDMETGEILYHAIREKNPKMKFLIISARDFKNMNTDFTKNKYAKLIQKPLTEDKIHAILKIVNGSKNG